jgi:hypothetical protein
MLSHKMLDQKTNTTSKGGINKLLNTILVLLDEVKGNMDSWLGITICRLICCGKSKHIILHIS